MKNREVLDRFIAGYKTGKGSNLKIEGDKLINYTTVIAKQNTGQSILLSNRRYSQTTLVHQNYIRKTAQGRVIEVDHSVLN